MVNAIYEIIHQFIRILQLIGIPIMGCLSAVGLLILLTSGKNPRRKRAGYIFVIAFSLGILLVAYAPLFTYTYGGEAPNESGGPLLLLIDEAGGVGQAIFKSLRFVGFPLTATMFYFGVCIRLHAGKNPQRKRLGLGLMMFSPIVFGAIVLIPTLLDKL